MYRALTLVVLIAVYSLIFGQKAFSNESEGFGDKLPEQVVNSAKFASLQVAKMEREWLQLALGLAKRQADFVTRAEGRQEGSLRGQAEQLHASATKLLADYEQMLGDAKRFEDTLNKAASDYRELASHYEAHASTARAGEFEAAYMQLSKAYQEKARAATRQAKALMLPSGAKGTAEVIREGNQFLERFVEALSINSLGDADREFFTGRLNEHKDRCKDLTEQLVGVIAKALEESELPEIRQRNGGKDKNTASPALRAESKELERLFGESWSCPITINRRPCLQVVAFQRDGTCSQSIYVRGTNGPGRLLTSYSTSFEMDATGILKLSRNGVLTERGRVSFIGNDRWSYEILESHINQKLTGRRFMFQRRP